MPGSVFFDLAVGDDLLPLVEFGAHELGALLRAGPARLDADLGQRGLEVGSLERLLERGVEARRHRRRQAGGRKHREPQIDLEPRQPRFGHGRHIGIDRAALQSGGRKGPHAIVRRERQRARDARERHLHLAAHHVGVGGADALIGHVHRVDPGAQLEHLAGKVRRGADAGRREVELAGIRFAIGDELGERLHRQGGAHHQHLGRRADDRNGLQALEEIVRNVRLQARIDDDGRVHQHQRVACLLYTSRCV